MLKKIDIANSIIAEDEVTKMLYNKHKKYVEAAHKAWETIEKKKAEQNMRSHITLGKFRFQLSLKEVSFGEYEIKPPLIKPSKLTILDNGGVGKELSDGWAVNFAVGCIFACPFCYVDNIHKRFTVQRVGYEIQRPWGMYFFKPKNIEEAIKKTPWEKWKGKLVMMSSTHDPYLPQLYPIPRKILEKGLKAGVKFLIQTRSFLVTKDFDLLRRYKDQVILQVSIATMNEEFKMKIEPRAPPVKTRLEILKRAKEIGLKTGVIIAPVFPPNKFRKDVKGDLDNIMMELKDIGVDHVFGEMLHERGINLGYLEPILGEKIIINEYLDKELGNIFKELLNRYGLKGKWWYEFY
jgi:DNA repair photolyase